MDIRLFSPGLGKKKGGVRATVAMDDEDRREKIPSAGMRVHVCPYACLAGSRKGRSPAASFESDFPRLSWITRTLARSVAR